MEQKKEQTSSQTAAFDESSALEILKDDVKQAESEASVVREKEQLLQLEVLLWHHNKCVGKLANQELHGVCGWTHRSLSFKGKGMSSRQE